MNVDGWTMATTTTTWNSTLYDERHSFVSKYGAAISQLLNPQKDEHILDLGCGTGDLAYTIQQAGAKVHGIDQSAQMIEKAHQKYPELSFAVENATELPFVNQFDAIFSNAVLHWIREPKKALESVYKGLKSGGRFVAEFGGQGNCLAITTALEEAMRTHGYELHDGRFPWYFPSIGDYTTLMENVGFQVIFAELVDRPTPLDGEEGIQNWLAMFCDSMFVGIPSETKQVILADAEQRLRETIYNHGQWVADYKRLRVIGLK